MSSTPGIEASIIHRLTLRIVPFVMLLYFIAYLDRVNVGFAALTMNQDIGLSEAAFGLGAGLFFIGYFFFEVPSNLILHRVGARIWIARIMFSWGIISALMAVVQGPLSFYFLRFLLGAAEAGFFPGIILYLSYWFPARHRAGITAMFMAAVPISTALGSPISGALLLMDGIFALHGWQWLFILEAFPAVILGFVVLGYMTDRPEKADWLTEKERTWLVNEMGVEKRDIKEDESLWQALSNPRTLALALVYVGTSAGLYTIGIYAPQIIASHGVNPLSTGFLNAIPAIFAIICMVLWARHSDRHNERTWHVVIACLVAAAGLVLASISTSLSAVMLALILVNIGVSSAKPPLWSMPTMFMTGSAAAAGIAAINSIGNLGGFLGPAIIGWIRQTTGSYAGGLSSVAGMLVFSAVLVLMLARNTKSRYPGDIQVQVDGTPSSEDTDNA